MRAFTRQVQKSIGQCAAQAKERGRTTQDAEKTAAGTTREERSALPPRGLGWRDSSRPSAGRQRGRVAGWAARLTLKQFFALPRNPLARRRIFSLRILSSTRAPTTTASSLWASGPVLPFGFSGARCHRGRASSQSAMGARVGVRVAFWLVAAVLCASVPGGAWAYRKGDTLHLARRAQFNQVRPPPARQARRPPLTPSSISLRQPPLARPPSRAEKDRVA